MIYLAITDTSKNNSKNIDDNILYNFNESIFEKIKNTGDENEKKLRLAAYSTLFYLYKKMYPEVNELPSVEFTEEGKPYFTKNDDIPCPVFSISHDRNFAAVVISDENIKLGVDIQSMPENKGRLERVAQRFLEVFRRSDSVYKKLMMENEMKKSNVRYQVSHIFLYLDEWFNISESDEGKLKEMIFEKKEKEYEYLTKWTALEASLKMSGGGFADYNDAENIIKDASIYNYIFSTKEKIDYSISISYI